jgi:putative tryptophan/tyrosine transport system substrate-binding protein
MMRREFIAGIAGAVVWSLTVHAQRSTVPVIGLLSTRAPGELTHYLAVLLQGLQKMGYVEGQNVSIESRFAANRYERLEGLAAELASRQVAVIVTVGTAAAPAAKAVSSTIPVVFSIADDPVRLGLVASLNRPGGNMTGVTLLSAELGPKRLELLHELVPAATNIAILLNPASSAMKIISKDLSDAAQTLGLQLTFLNAGTDGEIEESFVALNQQKIGALLVANDAFFNSRIQLLTTLATRYAVPVVYPYRDYVEAGGLMSYGADLNFVYHEVGVYAGRVLKGETPADLPIIQATQFEFVLNLKTAKALDLNVPSMLLANADEVIE